MPINKIFNDYAAVIDRIYADTPKAVLAAIAVSALTQGGDFLDEALPRLLREWDTLHANGIVPQPVPTKYRALREIEGEK